MGGASFPDRLAGDLPVLPANTRPPTVATHWSWTQPDGRVGSSRGQARPPSQLAARPRARPARRRPRLRAPRRRPRGAHRRPGGRVRRGQDARAAGHHPAHPARAAPRPRGARDPALGGGARDRPRSTPGSGRRPGRPGGHPRPAARGPRHRGDPERRHLRRPGGRRGGPHDPGARCRRRADRRRGRRRPAPAPGRPGPAGRGRLPRRRGGDGGGPALGRRRAQWRPPRGGPHQRRVRRLLRRRGRPPRHAQLLRPRGDRGQHRQRLRRRRLRRAGGPQRRAATGRLVTIWVDASSGASGDMLLGALAGAGVPVEVLQAAVDAIAPEPVGLRVEQVTRNGFAATRCHVEVPDSVDHRTWRDVRALLADADLDGEVRELALRTFERLAGAEGAVHGHDPDEVHFHEVGALDAIADVVGVCAGFVHLGSAEVVVSPVAVGSGSVGGAHGTLPVPPPAVAELLRGVPSYAGLGGAPAMELCTPTGAALLTTLATGWGPQPPMTTGAIGVGAGGRDPEGHANVLRLLVGGTTASTTGAGSATGDASGSSDRAAPLLIETNVDDLDPRVWPAVIAALLEAGASDAWLTPILMKKGRPAHTLSVLVDADRAPAARATIFRHTSTIGLREQPVTKHALEREMVSVEVAGHPVAVKLARHHGTVVNAQPEYDDVARAASELHRPVADVLAEAASLARKFL